MNASTLGRSTMLAAFKRSVWPWWLIVAAYYVVCCLMHLKVSLWLVRQRDTVLGRLAYVEVMPALVIAGTLVLLFCIARQLRRSPRPWLTGGYWLFWLAVVVAYDRYLTFAIIESVHYLQYGLLAWLLARASDPQRRRWPVGRVLFWATLMGAGDELLQYLWITSSYSDYLDFNDILMNLLAAVAGVLFYYGAAPVPRRDCATGSLRLEAVVAACLALGVMIGMQAGLIVHSPATAIQPGGVESKPDGSRRLYLQRGPAYYGSWQRGPRHGKYYVLPPAAGLGAMLVVGLLFSGMKRGQITLHKK
jgi:hypothetical protein